MTTPESGRRLETRIHQWRDYLRRRQAIRDVDVAELEDHLREQIDALIAAGLDCDEAFLVAVKRMGDLDGLSREFAREHSERLWKQMVVPGGADGLSGQSPRDAVVAFSLAVAAAVLFKLPALFGVDMVTHATFYMRNIGFFVLPLLAGYFVWKRALDNRIIGRLAIGFALALIAANFYPLEAGDASLVLTTLHLPVVLWLLVGVAYAGERWSGVDGRMDFVRFTGELFIYYVLIALGGGVLVGLTAMVFSSIGIDIEPVFESWLLPCGALGGVLVAAWLVEAKQSVVENMAPVLTRLFTPLFALLLVIFLSTLLISGRGVDVDREILIVFDLLLIVVLGLLLYAVSARDATKPPGLFDYAQLVLVISALLADAVALWAIVDRIGEMGVTPNRVAGLGLNLVLLVNLAWSTVLYLRFVRGRGRFAALEQWQTRYLPVYAAWAAIVVVVFPPMFGFG